MKHRTRILVPLFFLTILLLGIFTYNDYGISGDEIVNRNNGLLTYRYITSGDQELFSYRDRYYGTFFELPLIYAEKALGLSDPKDIFLMRHFATFFLFYIGSIFFYLLGRRVFSSSGKALLGTVFLILSPRIFAHAFYNSKDIAFMSLAIVAMYTLVRFLDKKDLLSAALHAAACAALIDIRVTGVVFPFITVLFFVYDLSSGRGRDMFRQSLGIGLYMILLGVLTFAFWPVLWEGPVRNFADAIKQMGHFPWDGTVLYMGEYVRAVALPWHYIPVWIVLTTPILYSALFLMGTFFAVMSFFGGRWSEARARDDLMFLSLLIFPLAAVVLTRAVLYDGWRHMLFVYPAFLMIAVSGLDRVWTFVSGRLEAKKGVIVKGIIAFIIAASLSHTLFMMAKMHPYENVYFNIAAGSMGDIRQRFEMDYWGLSYRKGLDYIAQNDDRQSISIYVSSLPGSIGSIPALMLDPADRVRLVFVDSPDKADYFVTNYRWHREDYPYENEVYFVDVNGAKIMSVFELRK